MVRNVRFRNVGCHVVVVCLLLGRCGECRNVQDICRFSRAMLPFCNLRNLRKFVVLQKNYIIYIVCLRVKSCIRSLKMKNGK